MVNFQRLLGLMLVLSLFSFGCAAARSGAGASMNSAEETGVPMLSVDEYGAKIQGRWVDPKKDSLEAFDKVKRGETVLAELTNLGFDPDAKVIGGQPKNKDEKKMVEEAYFSKPTKLEGPEAYELYEKMLFPGGTSNQVITEELREKRQAEVGRYVALVFMLENIKNRKDRFWFSTMNKLKVGYSYKFTFILKDGVVVEKGKKEEHFNDPVQEKSFGRGAVEAIKGIRELVPVPIPF